MIFSQFVSAELFWFAIADGAAEDSSTGKDDYSSTFNFATDPLCEAEHEIAIDEDADSVRQLIGGLALVSSVAKIDDWKHYVYNYCLIIS